jgi:hypothetical protein
LLLMPGGGKRRAGGLHECSWEVKPSGTGRGMVGRGIAA